MKTSTILLLIAAGVILYEHSKQQGVQWISCNDPKADPVMCALMEQQAAEAKQQALMEVLLG